MDQGAQFSHYEIAEKLGEGGMGVVYKARDLKLPRFVALKFLPPAASGPEDVARLKQEALAIGTLNHPNIATIYELDEESRAAALAGTGARVRCAACRGSGKRASKRGGSPRHEGRQCPVLGGRNAEDPRLRAGEDGRRSRPHANRQRARDAGDHVSGAGPGARSGRALRRVFARRAAIRDVHGRGAVPGAESSGGDVPGGARTAARDDRAAAGSARGPGTDSLQGSP